MLIVDVANVIGSRPTGWWRDRAGAAREFTERVRRALESGALDGPVVLVLEGKAKDGVGAHPVDDDGIEVVHAAGSGDDTIAELATRHGQAAVVVTADRELAARATAAGARVDRPGWLLDRIPD